LRSDNVYRHPLDYAIGAKYYLTRKRVDVEFKINSENFYVEEIVDFTKLGFDRQKGQYAVFAIRKKDRDTLAVLRKLSRILYIPPENIVVLGLKDKDSTSIQYAFIKRELASNPKEVENASDKYVEFSFIGYVARKPREGDLVGNKFEIVVENAMKSHYEVFQEIVSEIASKGLPSYYGYQRFGVKRANTHLLGKFIVLGRLDLFVHEILHGLYPVEGLRGIVKRLANTFNGGMVYERVVYAVKDPDYAVRVAREMTRDIFTDSYSSYLYNLLLNKIIEAYGWSALDSDYPTIGCVEYFDEYYKDLALIEGLSSQHVAFFKCWFRRGLFKPRSVKLEFKDNTITFTFILEKGFYASILLREIFKENLILA